MVRIVVGIFVVLHGLVHLLYAGQGRRLFELSPGLAWPDGAWTMSRFAGAGAVRGLATAGCVAVALIFAAGGIGVLAGRPWSRLVVAGAAALSAALYLIFWNGTLQRLPDQGAVGILINLALIVALLVVRRPSLGV